MKKIRIEDLTSKGEPSLQETEHEVKGGGALEKSLDGKSVGDTLKGTVKGFGSTTGEGPSTF